jgi:hypothetical protein
MLGAKIWQRPKVLGADERSEVSLDDAAAVAPAQSKKLIDM